MNLSEPKRQELTKLFASNRKVFKAYLLKKNTKTGSTIWLVALFLLSRISFHEKRRRCGKWEQSQTG